MKGLISSAFDSTKPTELKWCRKEQGRAAMQESFLARNAQNDPIR